MTGAAETDQTQEREADISALTYEQARDELVSIVNQLEAGGITLEESLSLWERGERLVAVCEGFLSRARERIEAVRGTASTQESS